MPTSVKSGKRKLELRQNPVCEDDMETVDSFIDIETDDEGDK